MKIQYLVFVEEKVLAEQNKKKKKKKKKKEKNKIK